jgi:photosystem II stability/assembly factor-like uncharacterized protein
VVDETEWMSFPPSLYSVHFIDRNRGWASGMDGIIIHTTDGGTSWKKIQSPAEEDKVTLYRIQIAEDRGWCIGQKGTSLFSDNAGRSWRLLSREVPTKFWLRDMDFCNESVGFVAGSRGTILKTVNGGKTWTMVSGIPVPKGL